MRTNLRAKSPVHGLLDSLDELTEHLAIELSSSISEDQLLEVGHVISALRRACGLLRLYKRGVTESADLLIKMYDKAKSTVAN